jgi:hypothetical protein
MICPCCLGKRLVLIVRLDEGASLCDQAAASAYEQECRSATVSASCIAATA